MSNVETYIEEMKNLHPEEYTKLIQGYDTEEELLQELKRFTYMMVDSLTEQEKTQLI